MSLTLAGKPVRWVEAGHRGEAAVAAGVPIVGCLIPQVADVRGRARPRARLHLGIVGSVPDRRPPRLDRRRWRWVAVGGRWWQREVAETGSRCLALVTQLHLAGDGAVAVGVGDWPQHWVRGVGWWATLWE